MLASRKMQLETRRAHAILTVKAVDESQRIIEGIASTPAPDRVGDIVESLGAQFKLPLPLLWQHRSDQPIGHVEFAKAGNSGIPFKARLARIATPGPLKDSIDTAWEAVKAGLVRGVSIGFRILEYSIMEGGGWRITDWEWLELSVVTIPANADATIQTVKHYDSQHRAAPGRSALPGVSGKDPPKTKGKQTMKTLEQRLADAKAKRDEIAGKITAISKTIDDEGREANDDESLELKDLGDDLDEVDGHLRLLTVRHSAQLGARAVENITTRAAGSRARETVPAQVKPPVEKGIRFARYARCLGLAHKMRRDVLSLADDLYGQRDPELVAMMKAVGAATPAVSSANAAALIGNEAGFADFAEYLRPMTIVGRFGANGIPALRGIPFRVPLINQTGKASAYWVGEGKGKPLGKQTFARDELAPLKIAVITAATMEVLRDSSPSAERLIRDDLAAAIVETMDLSFIDPTNSGTSNVEPASITDDIAAMTVASGGPTAANIREDVRAAVSKFIAANNPLTTGVWVMSSQTALALQLMVNDLGNREFPGITMNGGTFEGLPVITSEHVSGYVVLVNAGDVYLGDEGGIAIDMSTEASLQMVAGDDEGSTLDSAAAPPVATALVSMFQTNSVAFRAERTINWLRRRATAVALITSVTWGVSLDSPSA